MGGKSLAVTDELREYLLAHSIPRTDVHRRLVELTRTQLADRSIMQISEEQGPFLTFLVRLVNARNAVEIGTFTGLSALCIAEGLPPGGSLTCFDTSDEWTSMGVPFWEEAGVADRIDLVIGDAAETLPAHEFAESIDFAFIDADKGGYVEYVECLLQRMEPGGLIVADNAIFSGRVLDPDAQDGAKALRNFNETVAADDRLDCSLINVGDGLMLMRKR